MPQRGRRNNNHLLVMALACGATVENAAASAGVSPATVYRRRKDAEFQQELRNTKADMAARTTSMLTAAGGEAVKTLLRLLKDSMPPAIQLGAARAVLELGGRFRELSELEERMAVLERQLAQEAASKNAGPSPGQYRLAG